MGALTNEPYDKRSLRCAGRREAVPPRHHQRPVNVHKVPRRETRPLGEADGQGVARELTPPGSKILWPAFHGLHLGLMTFARRAATLVLRSENTLTVAPPFRAAHAGLKPGATGACHLAYR